MPSLRKRVTAVSGDILANDQLSHIAEPGAVINIWAAGVTNSDDLGVLIGNRVLIPQGTDVNIEAAADVIDTDRDQILFNEVVGPGKLQIPVGAVTTEMQVLISIKPL